MQRYLPVCGAAVIVLVIAANIRIGPAAGLAGIHADTRPDSGVEVKALRAQVKKLEELVPDQAAVMTHVGYHWSNLWFALQQEHWALADFYLSETRSNLRWAVRVRPKRKVGAFEVDLKAIAEALDNSQLAPLKDAIAKKDHKRCVKLYDETLTGCYACHKASDKSYLRPHRPNAPEVRVINFDPRAKEPG